MTLVLTVPPTVDEQAFDALVGQAAAVDGQRALVDARHIRWADPYGLLGLLVLGQRLAAAGPRPLLQLPESPELQSYLGRVGFAERAAEVFELHGSARPRRGAAPSPVLLEITPSAPTTTCTG
jgi:hypothetical protein